MYAIEVDDDHALFAELSADDPTMLPRVPCNGVLLNTHTGDVVAEALLVFCKPCRYFFLMNQ